MKKTTLLFINFFLIFLFSSFFILETPINNEEHLNKDNDSKIIYEGNNDYVMHATSDDVKDLVEKNINTNNVTLLLEVNERFIDEDKKNILINSTEEEINAYRRNRLNKIRNHYTTTNEKIFNSLNIYDTNDLYISKYSPYISLEIDKEALLEEEMVFLENLSENENIEKIYVQENMEMVPAMYDFTEQVGLPGLPDLGDLQYDGTGVKIGILEPGIIDKNHNNIKNSNYTIRFALLNKKHNHTTMVASIIGANTGIARGAHIYSAQLFGNPVAEVEWMIDHEVNIINNSWGEKVPTGNYSSVSAYFDKIVRNTWTTVIAAAGNRDGSDYVGNPALGYNVLAVGANSLNGNVMHFSSYDEKFYTSKPNLLSMGYINIPLRTDFENFDDFDSDDYYNSEGTSFSAACVSGLAALYMSRNSMLKVYPERIISMMMSTTEPVKYWLDDYDPSGLENKAGTGIVNYTNFINSINNHISSFVSNDAPEEVTTQYIYLNQGDNIKMTLYWLVENNNESLNVKYTDYDLRLYNSSNQIVAISQSIYYNVEHFKYTVPTSGNYKIVLFRAKPKEVSSNEYYSITWHID